MRAETARHILGTDGPFGLQDLVLADPDFRRATLAEWRRGGKVRLLLRGWYVWADTAVDLPLLFEVGCRAYPPSYVSLESALAWYALIPETVRAVTLVAARKTRTSESEVATFIWRTVSPQRWFGYRAVQRTPGHLFLLADPEKALLDYLYLHPQLRTEDDMVGLRLDPAGFRGLDMPKVMAWAERFGSGRLLAQVRTLREAMQRA